VVDYKKLQKKANTKELLAKNSHYRQIINHIKKFKKKA